MFLGPAPPAPSLAAAVPASAAAVDTIAGWRGPVPAMPRPCRDPVQPGLLVAGDAAQGFDPIGGDGTGHAVRGAVLAAGTLEALAAGDAAAAPRHRATLAAAMPHHLGHCLRYYAGFDGPGWAAERAAMASGQAESAPEAQRMAKMS